MILNDEQNMVRDMARDFAAARLAPNAAQWDREGQVPPEVLAVNAMAASHCSPSMTALMEPERAGATIFSDHLVLIIDRRMPSAKRELVEAFVKYLWSDVAQKAFVKHHFRAITDEVMNESEAKFGKIKMPFTIEDFGGWQRAYPEIIEGVWKYNVQAAK